MVIIFLCVVIDLYGDLKFYVGKDEGDEICVIFFVCFCILVWILIVFDRMLYGCFCEFSDKFKVDDDWEIDL